MKAKLSDVAERAGVSLTTVSRVINHDRTMNVTKETEAKIWESVRELNYTVKPRKYNKNSASRVKNIGYILTKDEYSFDDTYFADIIKGVELEITAKKCQLSFALSAEECSNEELQKKCESMPCDGIIFIGEVPYEIGKYFSDKNIPAVEMFSGYDEFQFDRISIDFAHTTYRLIDELIHLGHKNIAFLGDITGFSNDTIHLFRYEERFRGYVMALLANHIELSPQLIIDVNWDMETAYLKTKELLETQRDITAIFAANDRMAIGAMRAIQEHGYSIPDDISVIGCDNIDFSQYVTPPLTTISYPRKDLGREAVRILLEKIRSLNTDSASYTKNIKFSTKIIERSSVSRCLKDSPLSL